MSTTERCFGEASWWRNGHSFYERVVGIVKKSHTWITKTPSEELRELGSDLEAPSILVPKNLDQLWPPCMSQALKFHFASFLSRDTCIWKEYIIAYASVLLLIWIRGTGKSTSFGSLFHYLITYSVKNTCFISHLNLFSFSWQSLDFSMTSYTILKCLLFPHVFFPKSFHRL